ncbi:MAG: hypothetical protein HOG34_04250 [Bacteroidetes bacterium]|nr:hypothetical protein [Bacteroidota bacterium]
MDELREYGSEVAHIQCDAIYTGSSEIYNHNNLNELKRFKQDSPGIVLGLSDHTHGYATGLGSIAINERVIEKHFTDTMVLKVQTIDVP